MKQHDHLSSKRYLGDIMKTWLITWIRNIERFIQKRSCFLYWRIRGNNFSDVIWIY